MRKYQRFFILFIICINLNTLWFIHPLSDNLSYLGNTLHMGWYLSIWASSSALYFFLYTRQWMKQIHYHNIIGYMALTLSCIGMVLSVCLPYAPYEYAFLSKWHTRVAMGSTIVYILLIFHILAYLFKTDIVVFQKISKPYINLVLFELAFYVIYGGVSTLLEILFSMAMAIYLYYVYELQENG